MKISKLITGCVCVILSGSIQANNIYKPLSFDQFLEASRAPVDLMKFKYSRFGASIAMPGDEIKIKVLLSCSRSGIKSAFYDITFPYELMRKAVVFAERKFESLPSYRTYRKKITQFENNGNIEAMRHWSSKLSGERQYYVESFQKQVAEDWLGKIKETPVFSYTIHTTRIDPPQPISNAEEAVEFCKEYAILP